MANDPKATAPTANGGSPDDDRRSGHWTDDREREHREPTDRHGMGQSGYGAGRHDEDRSIGIEHRNAMSPSYYDRESGGLDDRWTGRGYWQDQSELRGGGRPGGYGGHHPGGAQGMPGHGRQSAYGHGQQPPMPPRGPHRGKGPKGYVRSDERIRELVCEALSDDEHVDAREVEVTVAHGEVTLAGLVSDRHAKRRAEDVAERVSGVRDVLNQIRVQPDNPERSGAV